MPIDQCSLNQWPRIIGLCNEPITHPCRQADFCKTSNCFTLGCCMTQTLAYWGLRCERCHRPLNAATWSVKTKNGPLNFGPKCARLSGYTPPERTRSHKVVQPKEVDESQMELELTCAV